MTDKATKAAKPAYTKSNAEKIIEQLAGRTVHTLVVHCSASPNHLDIGAAEIDQWHKARGWAGIGYHVVIRRDGGIEKGRPLSKAGAHVVGANTGTIAVVLVGGENLKTMTFNDNYTEAQEASLVDVLTDFRSALPNLVLKGHRDYPNVGKACPIFDVKAWAETHGL